ncbi:MAG: MaoC family dehydratase [Anaerolineaceae bacterium]|nr:MaoC family dehydratase [Anaerolineaceae bacterium]
MKFEEFTIGQEHHESHLVTQEEINAFAQVSGDQNPLHIDPDFASKSIFGRPIAHGVFGLSLISAALGMRFPGFGTIYMSQEAKFMKPIFIGETVDVSLTIKSLEPEKKRMVLSTRVLKEDGEAAIDGEAKVQYNPDLFVTR